MPKTTLSKILANIESALSQVTVDNGYETDIGLNVFYWQSIGFEFGIQQGVSFQDTSSLIEQLNTSYEHSQVVQIIAVSFVEHEPENSEFNIKVRDQADRLRSDLFRVVRENESWGSLAFNTAPSSADSTSLIVETEGQTAIRFLIEIEIKYRTEKWEI